MNYMGLVLILEMIVYYVKKYIQGSERTLFEFYNKKNVPNEISFDYCKMDKYKDEVYKNHKKNIGVIYQENI